MIYKTNIKQQLIFKAMKKTIFREYTAPELELYTSVVESGFAVSDFTTGGGNIDDGTEDDWGTLN